MTTEIPGLHCMIFYLGGVEDAYILPLAERFNAPLFAFSVTDNEKLSRLLLDQWNLRIPLCWEFYDHVRQLADQGELRALASAYYPTKLEYAETYLVQSEHWKSIQVCHGICDRNRTADSEYEAFKCLRLYDLVLVDNLYWANMINEGLDRPVAHVVGNIQLSLFLQDNPLNQVKKEWAEILDFRGLDPDAQTVLYSPSWRSESRDDRLGNGMFDRWWRDICESVPNNVNLIVKLHPKTYELVPKVVEACSRFVAERPNAFIADRRSDYLPAMINADLVISDHSSLCASALALDKPLIIFDPTEDPLFYDFIVRRSTYVDRVGALGEAVRKELAHPARLKDEREEFRAESRFVNAQVLENVEERIRLELER